MTIVIEEIRPSAMFRSGDSTRSSTSNPREESSYDRYSCLPKGSIALAACGAFAGWWTTAVMRPYLRAIDPTGYSPIILICLLGGMVLFWYLRRCSQARVKA
jgi:hypothetical protein